MAAKAEKHILVTGKRIHCTIITINLVPWYRAGRGGSDKMLKKMVMAMVTEASVKIPEVMLGKV